MDNQLSIDVCPLCEGTTKSQLKWKPYGQTVYKCRNCKCIWNEKATFCGTCKDVVLYCKCYEDIMDV